MKSCAWKSNVGSARRSDDLSGFAPGWTCPRRSSKTEVDIQSSEQAIREEVPRKVAEVIAGMLDADCACRQRLVELARRSQAQRLSALLDVRGKLVELIESAYASVTHDLMRELRTTASNAGAFALLGLGHAGASRCSRAVGHPCGHPGGRGRRDREPLSFQPELAAHDRFWRLRRTHTACSQ